MKTTDEQLERMEALLRRMADYATVPNELGVKTCRKWQDDAKEIVAELDKSFVGKP